MEKNEVFRLEHFTALAKEGQHIEATIDLKRQIVTKKVYSEETQGVKSEAEMYLLLAEFNFKVEGEIKKVSKVYVYGTSEESMDSTNQNLRFADERLKVDYARLRNAHITFEERYFSMDTKNLYI